MRAWVVLFLACVSSAHALEALELKTGDVILQSVPCYLCSLIEIEEGAPYSHMGIIVKNGNSISVLQSWQKVEAISLAATLAIRRPNTHSLILRPVDRNGNELHFDAQKFNTLFSQRFNNLSYDEAFLWNNRDAKGEKLYCSEFAAKFIDRFLPFPIAPKAMHYTHNRKDWVTYFKGMPPDGQPGISPADFYFSPLFKHLGEL